MVLESFIHRALVRWNITLYSPTRIQRQTRLLLSSDLVAYCDSLVAWCSSCCWVISCNDPRDKDWTRRRRRRTLQGVPCPACHAPSAHPSHPPGLGALRRSSSALPPRQRHRHFANQRQWFRCLASHLLKRRHSPQAATRRSWHAPSRHRDSYDPIPCRRSQRQSPVPKQVIRARL